MVMVNQVQRFDCYLAWGISIAELKLCSNLSHCRVQPCVSFTEEESQGLPAEFYSSGRRQMPSLNNLKRAGGRNINGFDHKLCLFNIMSLRGVLSSIHSFGGDVSCFLSCYHKPVLVWRWSLHGG